MSSEGKYSGRAVAVTGARKGIGRALSAYFLAQGAKVAGLSRSESAMDSAGFLPIACDVGNPESVQQAFLKIGREFGGLDILVNNAGVLTSQYSLLLSAADAEAMVRTNLLGTFFCSREAAKLMKRGKRGRIINIGSMAASLEPAGDSVYAACKAGVASLANVMAREFAAYGVTCNTLGITAIPSDMLEKLPKDKIDAIIQSLPIPRYATEEDIFNVVDFFAADRSAYVTAQTVYLGGIH